MRLVHRGISLAVFPSPIPSPGGCLGIQSGLNLIELLDRAYASLLVCLDMTARCANYNGLQSIYVLWGRGGAEFISSAKDIVVLPRSHSGNYAFLVCLDTRPASFCCVTPRFSRSRRKTGRRTFGIILGNDYTLSPPT
jgi:hypothetical protein